jgi:hypothetical protein
MSRENTLALCKLVCYNTTEGRLLVMLDTSFCWQRRMLQAAASLEATGESKWAFLAALLAQVAHPQLRLKQQQVRAKDRNGKMLMSRFRRRICLFPQVPLSGVVNGQWLG